MQEVIITKISKTVGLLILLLSFSLVGLFNGRVYSQNKPGITVSPAILNVDLLKGEGTKTGLVNVRNDYSRTVRFEASIRGMRLSGNNSLVPSDVAEANLLAALSITPTSFTLEPGKTLDIKLTLNDYDKLSPGGHYASLLVKEVSEAKNQLSLSPAVSVALFVIKEEGAIRAVQLTSIDSIGNIFQPPQALTASFVGSGNVGVVPRASVNVYDPLGNLVMSGVLNTESVSAYPGKQVRLQTKLTSLALSWAPGRYREEVLYRYDGSDEHQVAIAHKLVVPPPFLAAMLAVITIIIAVVRFVLSLVSRARRKKLKSMVRRPSPDNPRPRKNIDGVIKAQRRTDVAITEDSNTKKAQE